MIYIYILSGASHEILVILSLSVWQTMLLFPCYHLYVDDGYRVVDDLYSFGHFLTLYSVFSLEDNFEEQHTYEHWIEISIYGLVYLDLYYLQDYVFFTTVALVWVYPYLGWPHMRIFGRFWSSTASSIARSVLSDIWTLSLFSSN